MRGRGLVVGIAAAATVVAVAAPVTAQQGGDEPPGTYRSHGDPGGFWSIVPPGQDGVLNGPEAAQASAGGGTPEHFDDQLGLYEGIVYDDLTPGFTKEQLPEAFVDGSYGIEDLDAARVYSPGGRDDVVVLRDAEYGIPRIHGETREAAEFGNGYTAGEDRLFLIDVLRHVGRAQLSAFLGASPGNLAMDADLLADAPYVEADLTDQVADIREQFPQLGADADAYIAGLNQYVAEALVDPTLLPAEYPALQVLPDEFVVEDIVAIAGLVGGIFGKGGGGEVGNHCALQTLEDRTDADDAREIFEDFVQREDLEAPTVTSDTFTYLEVGDVDPAAHPDIDCESLQLIEAPDPGVETFQPLVPVPPAPAPGLPGLGATAGGPIGLDGAGDGAVNEITLPDGTSFPLSLQPGSMSNAVLFAADVTDTGNPIVVFGPQTGYFAPQLLREFEIHAPGLDARGVSFAGTDIYVELGRGPDYAWSATSASGDLVDELVIELCEPDGGEPTIDSMGYVKDGACLDIEAFTETYLAKPTAAGVPESPEDLLVVKHFERADEYGFLTLRGTLTDDTPIAITKRRSTYGQELSSAEGFRQINDPTFVDGVEGFRRAFAGGVDYTFNWFYVDEDDIGYQHSCLCPVRAEDVDPYFPVWAGRHWDWTGEFLSMDEQPFDVNPSSGYLVSWNNKQAPGFRSADDKEGFGPIHRSTMLEERMQSAIADGPVDVGAAVDVMALASTTDLRAQELVPLLERLLGDTAPDDVDDRVQDVWDRMRTWAADDLGHRRDHDEDGAYEHPEAISAMDAWWEPLVDAMFDETSFEAREAIGVTLHDDTDQGSAFQDAMYSHVQKDLRQVLGDDVVDPTSRTYCGSGDAQACADDVWEALDAAVAALADEFDSEDVDDWDRTVADDAVLHSAIGVVGVRPIHWTNRPTYQQVVAIEDAPAAAPTDPAAPASPTATPAPAANPTAAPAPGTSGGSPLPTTGGGLALLGLGAVLLAGRARRRR